MSSFRFNISLSVLNHLGRNLYRNFITVLGEAISNSWDADAKNVHIYINREENYLVIKDDGEGMTSDDFQNKFLKIGYSKRKDGQTKTKLNRPFIGRKGIGKLALLSCAKKVHIISKAIGSDIVSGTIDNSELDKAIQNDINSQDYPLESIDINMFNKFTEDFEKGTIIYFESINDGVKNKIEYIEKLIALFFRFSLIDESFNIYINDKIISLSELANLANDTQFVWAINDISDPFLDQYLLPRVKSKKSLKSNLPIKGFIASVQFPKDLKISGSDEKVTLDLFVNGRLREKDILKHIPTDRIVESYLYGQIHFDVLDDNNDRFTSSREGVVADDELFNTLLKEIKENLLKEIFQDWDIWRVLGKNPGDPENTRMTKKERKSKELVDIVSDEFTPSKDSQSRHLVDSWVDQLLGDAQFNVASYAECFISENILRKYIEHSKVILSTEASKEVSEMRKKENDNKGKANISFNIREYNNDLAYLDMDNLANLIDKVDPIKDAGLSRDAKEYKPVRDAMAHTSLLTKNAKNRLNSTYENIKARIKQLFQ